jgi:hypothetical protein
MESIFIINKIGTKMMRSYDIGNQGKTSFFITPGSSPVSRTGYEQGNNDWLNIMEFGDKIFNYFKSFEKSVLSKLGVG